MLMGTTIEAVKRAKEPSMAEGDVSPDTTFCVGGVRLARRRTVSMTVLSAYGRSALLPMTGTVASGTLHAGHPERKAAPDWEQEEWWS